MSRVVSVTGFHRAGKTKVVVAIVRELTKRGYRVGTVKHIPEEDFTIDQPGKDTWLHAKAGAKVVVSLAAHEVARMEKRSANLAEALEGLQVMDFAVVEGFKNVRGFARVVVAQSKAEADKLIDEFTIACVGAKCASVPTFGFRETAKIVDIIEEKAYPLLPGLDCKICGYDSCDRLAAAIVSGKERWNRCQAVGRVTLTVDGKVIPLIKFPQKIFESTVKGMVASLRDAKGTEIELRVKKHAR